MSPKALLLALTLLSPEPAAGEPLGAALVCQDPGIIDGDTIRCLGIGKVRIWGIDAPEHNTPEGPAATRALARLTRGQTLICTPRGHSYDRIVALCHIGATDIDIGAEMVRSGHAIDWPKYSHGAYARWSRGERR